MMTERAALGYQIGQASFDDFAELPGDKRSLRNSFDIGEDFDTSPALLDCVLVSTVGDLRGQPVAAGKPRGYSRTTQGNETAYGLLLRDVPGSGGFRKVRVGPFREEEGLSPYFDDGPDIGWLSRPVYLVLLVVGFL
ncbi:hypothetical protein CH35J_003371 [Colletotrichum higginsianum]|uniref:Uncharacterized protein n=1 Tax=Colletotrichum higginsianum TaxID=80884 RepID=A0A4T0W9H3_9PEZI|nr:hypothetical protein CH35J_003371 [Colletotrichum higginsianum]